MATTRRKKKSARRTVGTRRRSVLGKGRATAATARAAPNKSAAKRSAKKSALRSAGKRAGLATSKSTRKMTPRRKPAVDRVWLTNAEDQELSDVGTGIPAGVPAAGE